MPFIIADRIVEPGRVSGNRRVVIEIEIAQRILNDIESLRAVREDYNAREQGGLTIATTHSYARYVLPRVVEKSPPRRKSYVCDFGSG